VKLVTRCANKTSINCIDAAAVRVTLITRLYVESGANIYFARLNYTSAKIL